MRVVVQQTSDTPDLLESVRLALMGAGVVCCYAAQVLADRPRVVTIGGELERAGMAQHVRVNGKAESGGRAGAREEFPKTSRAHRLAAFVHKHMKAEPTLAP